MAAAVLLLAAGGCGPRGPVAHPVSGTVAYSDGTPYTAGGMIQFVLEVIDGKRVNASAAINPDGTFQMTSFEEHDGAMEGSHQVLVRGPRPIYEPWEGGDPPQPALHRKFERYETSGLSFTVVPGANHCELVVERP